MVSNGSQPAAGGAEQVTRGQNKNVEEPGILIIMKWVHFILHIANQMQGLWNSLPQP